MPCAAPDEQPLVGPGAVIDDLGIVMNATYGAAPSSRRARPPRPYGYVEFNSGSSWGIRPINGGFAF